MPQLTFNHQCDPIPILNSQRIFQPYRGYDFDNIFCMHPDVCCRCNDGSGYSFDGYRKNKSGTKIRIRRHQLNPLLRLQGLDDRHVFFNDLQIEGPRIGFKPQLLQALFLNPVQLRKKSALFDTADDFAG